MSKGIERRNARRRPLLDSFSFFVVVPRKGVHRLRIHDVSDLGMLFDLDMEGESQLDFPIAKGESFDVQFYLNQSLYLPLTVQVARIEQVDSVRRIGTEISDKKSKSYQAFLSFLTMLDTIVDEVRLTAERI
jgi:hypothetical protein